MSRGMWIGQFGLLVAVPVGINLAQDAVVKPPATAQPTLYFPQPSAIEQKIHSKLDERTELQFADTPMQDAIQFLKDLHGLQIWIDQGKLAEDTVDLSKPITLQLSGITLRSALKLLLEPEGLTYMVEDEVLKVTTITCAEENLKTRVYPIADLVSHGDDVWELMQILQTSTGYDKWEMWEEDGRPGKHTYPFNRGATQTPSFNRGAIVIRQTEKVHDEIVEILQNLRQVPKCDPIVRTLPLQPACSGNSGGKGNK